MEPKVSTVIVHYSYGNFTHISLLKCLNTHLNTHQASRKTKGGLMLCDGCEVMQCTSLIIMRPAMRRRVKGGKCEVMRRRRLASEKESWWGCRLSISSTITTPESCPATTHESGENEGIKVERRGFNKTKRTE